jgi:hypothetical protein
MTTEEQTEAVERKPREWWLVTDEHGSDMHVYHNKGLAEGEVRIRGYELVHVVEVLEKSDGKG